MSHRHFRPHHHHRLQRHGGSKPVHIEKTLKKGCVIETVITHSRGAALCTLLPRGRHSLDRRGAPMRASGSPSSRPAETSPSPRAARVSRAHTHKFSMIYSNRMSMQMATRDIPRIELQQSIVPESNRAPTLPFPD